MKATLIAAAAALALAACSKNNEEPAQETAPATSESEAAGDAGAAEHPAPSQQASPHGGAGSGGSVAVTVEDGVADFGAFRAEIPEGWEYAEPASRMRVAEFAVSEEGEGEPVKLVVYYFGQRGAGGVQANIDRWVGQFETEEEPAIEKQEMAGLPVTTVDVSGRYVAPVRPGAGQTHDKPNQRMFAAIVETPQGPFYFRLLADAETVSAQMERVNELLASMKPAGE